VYAVPADNEEAPHLRTVDACQTVRNYLGIFEWMRRSMMRRVEAPIESHGGHFEHLWEMYIFRCNSQIKCFRTRVDMVIFIVLACETRVQNLSAPFRYTLYTYIYTYISNKNLSIIADKIYRNLIMDLKKSGNLNLTSLTMKCSLDFRL
jgi:hypothetical protein